MIDTNLNNTLINYRQERDILLHDIKYNAKTDEKILFFLLFNEIVNYNLGLFKLDKKEHYTPIEEQFLELENLFLRYLILNNELFITYLDNKFQFWYIKEKEYNGLELSRLRVQQVSKSKTQPKIVEFNPSKGILVIWDINEMDLLVKVKGYLDLQIEFFKAWKTSVYLDNKKFIYNINNNSERISETEINSMLDPSKPFIFNINPFTTKSADAANILVELNKGDSTSQITYQNLTNLRNFFKDVYGYALPKEFKAERKNLTESITENYVSENTEAIILKNLNNFLSKASKKWNLNLRFTKNQELILNQTEELKNANTNQRDS